MHRSTLPRFPLACAAIACSAVFPGCEQQSEDEPRGGGYVAESAPAPQAPAEAQAEEAAKPRARSAYGKAKEFAEKVINEDVAEYQRKLMEEADRKP